MTLPELIEALADEVEKLQAKNTALEAEVVRLREVALSAFREGRDEALRLTKHYTTQQSDI